MTRFKRHRPYYIMMLATVIFIALFFLLRYVNPSSASETVITILAIVTGVAFWVEYHHNCKVNEAQFVMELNNQFIGDDKMANVEHILELFYYLILKEASDRTIDAAMKELRLYFDRKKTERQDLVNYLVHLEGIATMVNTGVLRVETISDLMGYRFFIAVNNPVVQELELNPYRDYYKGIDQLFDYWSTKIYPMPLEKFRWKGSGQQTLIASVKEIFQTLLTIMNYPKKQNENAMRVYKMVTSADTDKQIGYLVDATRSMLVWLVDAEMMFRAFCAVIDSMPEDLKYRSSLDEKAPRAHDKMITSQE